jgi:hypothetical protein
VKTAIHQLQAYLQACLKIFTNIIVRHNDYADGTVRDVAHKFCLHCQKTADTLKRHHSMPSFFKTELHTTRTQGLSSLTKGGNME